MNFAELTAMQSQDNARKAALTIHAMKAADRDWVMAQMGASHQQQLQTLLDELTAMGIPADSALLRQASQAASPPIALPTHAVAVKTISDGEYFQTLDCVAVDSLIAILRDEPALLTARLLSIQVWSWHQTVLEGLPQLKRQQILKCLERSQVERIGPTLTAVLLATLRLRCEPSRNAEMAPGVPDRGSRTVRDAWSTWLARLKGKLT